MFALRVHKAQVSIEVLLITSIILVGILLAFNPYMRESSKSVVILAVRNTASSVPSYVNLRVQNLEDSKYSSLNKIIERYHPANMKFVGLKILDDSGDKILIFVKFEHDLSLDSTQNTEIAKNIGNFIITDLSTTNRFQVSAGSIYYQNLMIMINVSVENGWVMVP